MKPLSSWLFAVLVGLALSVSGAQAAEIHLAQGLLAGEVTASSVILQSRLTAAPGLVNGDVPGAAGGGRFEIATSDSFADARRTPWLWARPERDFIVKTLVDSLQPATRYYFRLVFGPSEAAAKSGTVAQFKTLPAATVAAPLSFVLTSCMNYGFYMEGTGNKPGYTGPDRDLGYPALVPLAKLRPDFCIIDGDCVYYDHPIATTARTLPQLRKKWHEQYVMPRFVDLFARVPTYWLKDDHDHRMNDSDATGDYEPSHALGIATFREQVPVVNPADPKAVTYRTHRMGRDLQLWFVEGRDYRSPNAEPDGPNKTIWGAEQKAWLQRTIKESDATFKILVSPTPLIGPDDDKKKDNHVNPSGFKQEGEAFLAWLKANGVRPGRFFIICGDRHWKYHSQHSTGFEELTCGALNRENARTGRRPGEKKSTDPQKLVKQLYSDRPASGGFLHVALQPAGVLSGASLAFTQYNDLGEVVYQHKQSAK